MSDEPTIPIRATAVIRRLLSRRLSLMDDATSILHRVAARYEEICDACVPAELTDAHWNMINAALYGVAPSDQPNLMPGRAALRDYVELYATLPPPEPIAVHLMECMARWTTAQWVAVLDRAERRWQLQSSTDAGG